MAGMATRPVTSKPRGLCKYYTTERGCFAGKNCKFLHGEAATHTPFDKAKVCRFYASGFCKRGASCWFLHTKGKEKFIDEEDDLCSICFEVPVTYGLLTGCSHVFCITCIKQWRSSLDKTLDAIESGNTKRCPMCRQSSKFIIPSSAFYAQGHPDKDVVVAKYKESMKKVPCKYFQRSLATSSAPYCRFGKDCFYQHRNADGTEHIPTHGALMRRSGSQRELPPLRRSDLIHSLENVFAESARLGMNVAFNDDGWEEETAVMRRLELLADQMLASLSSRVMQPESDDEEPMPLLEAILPAAPPSHLDDNDDMPSLASISNNSESGHSFDAENNDEPPTLDASSPSAEQHLIRPFDLEFREALGLTQSSTSLVQLTSPEAELASVVETVVEAVPQTAPHDEVVEGPHAQEPPFVTDGRGRVVWSSSPDSASSSSARRSSVTVSGRTPDTVGERGFTTDGRGRVIGTNRRQETENGASEGTSPRAAPSSPRSFLGRVLNALF